MLHKSIRFRIQFWHSLLLALTTIGLSVTYYFYETQMQRQLVDSQLHNHSVHFLPMTERHIIDHFPERFPRQPEPANRAPAISPNQSRPPRPLPRSDSEQTQPLPPRHRPPADRPLPPPNRPQRPNLHEEAEAAGLYIYAWDRERTPLFRSRNSPETFPELPLERIDQKKPFIGDFQDSRGFVTNPRFGATFIFAKDTSHLQEQFSKLRLKLLGLDLAIIFAGIAIGWQLTGRAIKPIHLINDTAKKIAAGQRNKRIESSITDCELGQLVQVLNDTFDKLDHSFDQQVKFTADASHELRTPVAAMLTQIQLALSRDRSVEEYKEHLQACQSQALHMRSLLNSLLDLARSDSGEIEFRLADYDVAGVIMECCEWLESLAAEKNLRFHTQLENVTAKIDGLRIGQVITNILSNAIAHSPAGSCITISLTKDDRQLAIDISDQGPGIPPEAKGQIFERFYRASRSRSSSQGSVGLGLAIAKAIVDKHRGHISAKNNPVGATFTITLPLEP